MEYLTQEEIERRKYLRKRIRQRKRRQRAIIARAVLAVAGILIIIGLFFLVKFGASYIMGIGSGEAKSTQAPTSKPEVIIPEGYQNIYKKLKALKKAYPDTNDIIMNLAQYPKDILKLFINNQETLSFVLNYPRHKNDSASSGELSDEEVADGIPSLKQWDGRWGYVKYGNSIIAISGCGPTCMSMVYSGLLKNISMSPADMAEYCTDKGYYSQDTGTSWAMMLDGAKDLGLDAEKIPTGSIKTALSAGKPVICSMAPGDFTDQGHFIVLTGIDRKGRIIVNDPNSIARSKKHWKLEKIQEQAKAAWSYSVP
ncbi:MAG TPA: hypothetical protein DCZ23_00835 [Lachnospiraceae bacterium]|nr:hypothetical protein [Lachnospiraceae bacterium]